MAHSTGPRPARTRGNRPSRAAGDGTRRPRHRRKSVMIGPIDQRKRAEMIVAIVLPSALIFTAIAAVILALSGCVAEPMGFSYRGVGPDTVLQPMRLETTWFA
jgi:hypothetical protein